MDDYTTDLHEALTRAAWALSRMAEQAATPAEREVALQRRALLWTLDDNLATEQAARSRPAPEQDEPTANPNQLALL